MILLNLQKKVLMLFKENFTVLQILFLIIVSTSISARAQLSDSDSIVFRIDKMPVYKSEFIKQYKKNKQSYISDKDLSIEEYVDLYLKFKLKVEAAKKQGLDTVPEFLEEYNGYRKQLADRYISNGKVTEDLVKETYHRLTNEVNVSHILITVKPDATPSDTLEAYNTAIDILKKINNNESFEELALKFSKDPSVRTNKGNVGWFKANKMVYPFETTAYELDINEISNPIRTKFGYHIIKKEGQRRSRGKLKVAHIMKSIKAEDSTYNAENEIQKIYKKLENAGDFENLAKQFSDHKSSALNGGELTPFGVGELNSAKFEQIAFDLNSKNPISKPFKTKFGWHIVKYIDEIPIEPLEKIKEDIIRNIKTSKRSKLLIKNIKDDLMTKYEVHTNYEALSSLIDRVDESIIRSKWEYKSQNNDSQTWILKIEKQNFYLDEFLKYIEKQQRTLEPQNKEGKINTAIDRFAYAKLINYHNFNLENTSPEFAREIKTYFEGLLLFDIMQKKIWKPTQEDSLALKNYYNSHPEKFMSEINIDGLLASSSSKASLKKIKRDIKKDSINILKKKYKEAIFRSLNQTNIEDSALPENLDLNINKPKIYKNNGEYICINITKIYPKKQLEYKNIKGRVIGFLQEEREKKWIEELKQEHDIYVNTDLIKKLEQEFEN